MRYQTAILDLLLLCTADINDVQFLEGDIILTSAQQKLLEASYTAMDMPLNAVSTFEENLWPNGVIPYVLDSNLCM